MSHGDDLHNRTNPVAAGNGTQVHANHAVNPLRASNHSGQAVLDRGSFITGNNTNDDFNRFKAITTHGIGYKNDCLSLVNNVGAGFSPCGNVAAPTFTNWNIQGNTVTSNANSNFNGVNGDPSNDRYIETNYLSQTLGNVTSLGIAYDRGLSAALQLQGIDDVYPTSHAEGHSHPPNDGTIIGTAYGSNDGATNGTALDAPSEGATSTMSGTVSHFTPGFVGDL